MPKRALIEHLTDVGEEFAAHRERRRKGEVLAWWRDETTDDGKITSCERVPEREDARANVFYVLAITQAEALESGRRAYNAFCQKLLNERRARYAAEGRCRCGRVKDADGQYCSKCREQARAYKQRDAARARGEVMPRPDRREAIRQRKDEEAADIRESVELVARKAVLLEVQRAWISANNNRQFSDWLSRELSKLGVKEVPRG